MAESNPNQKFMLTPNFNSNQNQIWTVNSEYLSQIEETLPPPKKVWPTNKFSP